MHYIRSALYKNFLFTFSDENTWQDLKVNMDHNFSSARISHWDLNGISWKPTIPAREMG